MKLSSVNNHKNTIIFVGAIVANGKEETYVCGHKSLIHLGYTTMVGSLTHTQKGKCGQQLVIDYTSVLSFEWCKEWSLYV